MTHEQNTPQMSDAESMLLDPAIQDGLGRYFADLDNLYDGVKTQATDSISFNKLWPTSITPSGTVIEVRLHSSSRNSDDAPERRDSQYLAFVFNLADLRDPDFKLMPKSFSDIAENRGSGIGLTFDNPDDPKPVFDESTTCTKEVYEQNDAIFAAWRNRNVLHLPQLIFDSIKMGDEIAEKFQDVRKRINVTL